jgi:hypothetical protein
MLYALGCHKLNGFGPLNRAVQLASASRIASGAVSHFTSTLFTTEIVGALKVIFAAQPPVFPPLASSARSGTARSPAAAAHV